MKATANLNSANYLSVRYGRNQNSQPYGADAQPRANDWGDSANEFNSINLNHNWVIGGTKLNEFIFQYADFANDITARSQDPYQTFPNGVAIGPEPEHAADHASRRSGSSATTSRGTSPARAASATT